MGTDPIQALQDEAEKEIETRLKKQLEVQNANKKKL